jgi:mxaJ protein
VSRISGTLTIIDVAVDVALVWGPLASYFAARPPVPLRLEPVTPWTPDMQWPMQFDISVGVQKNDRSC